MEPPSAEKNTGDEESTEALQEATSDASQGDSLAASAPVSRLSFEILLDPLTPPGQESPSPPPLPPRHFIIPSITVTSPPDPSPPPPSPAPQIDPAFIYPSIPVQTAAASNKLRIVTDGKRKARPPPAKKCVIKQPKTEPPDNVTTDATVAFTRIDAHSNLPAQSPGQQTPQSHTNTVQLCDQTPDPMSPSNNTTTASHSPVSFSGQKPQSGGSLTSFSQEEQPDIAQSAIPPIGNPKTSRGSSRGRRPYTRRQPPRQANALQPMYLKQPSMMSHALSMPMHRPIPMQGYEYPLGGLYHQFPPPAPLPFFNMFAYRGLPIANVQAPYAQAPWAFPNNPGCYMQQQASAWMGPQMKIEVKQEPLSPPPPSEPNQDHSDGVWTENPTGPNDCVITSSRKQRGTARSRGGRGRRNLTATAAPNPITHHTPLHEYPKVSGKIRKPTKLKVFPEIPSNEVILLPADDNSDPRCNMAAKEAPSQADTSEVVTPSAEAPELSYRGDLHLAEKSTIGISSGRGVIRRHRGGRSHRLNQYSLRVVNGEMEIRPEPARKEAAESGKRRKFRTQQDIPWPPWWLEPERIARRMARSLEDTDENIDVVN